MSTKFFNNASQHTLFDKLKGIASGMQSFEQFLAVAGFFRSSGYFKLRQELNQVEEIKILVGINIDDIFRKHNKALLMLDNEEKAKKIYTKGFQEDIVHAHYAPEVEEGILQMCEDLLTGKLQMRIHATKNLHAKFYLCLPKEHNEHTDGWVIMGSSNISNAGLGIKQPPQYELNIALKDYDDVKYCADEFWTLWNEAIPLSSEDIQKGVDSTYLGYQPTPYELYIKVLIDTFGDQVEDDFTIQLPEGIKELKYQKDAVIQGYQMLLEHNGLFLADVVGLGKTMIATMIAKRFVEANGKNTNILVIYPPALEDNWKTTFQLFSLTSKAQFVSNGSLSKVIDGRDRYKNKEEFNLIIVDEAHTFRTDTSGRYDELQKICKSDCNNIGLLKSTQKKVMLLSATPLNNRPEDLQNQLLLFQNSQTCTIDGIPSLKAFFSPHIEQYKKLMRERDKRDVTTEVDAIYEEIRNKVIDKVTIRRTRNNILNDNDYKQDIHAQGITFPKIEAPRELEYQMDTDTNERFYYTLKQLTDSKSEDNPDGQGLTYARYRAVEFLKPDFRGKYTRAEHIGHTLAGIYRVHMVKRLESSFYAFKKSLQTLLRITNDMIHMFEENKVIIAPELKVKDLFSKGMELDEILEYAYQKGYIKEEILFPADAFEPEFLDMLLHDQEILKQLNADWEKEIEDPKFELFKNKFHHTFFDKNENLSGKIVLFSESVDTINYLYKRITEELDRKDVLMVTADNRKQVEKNIKENFDANYPTKANTYNIILTSDVLAEGVNLHRSNVIINYDSPWNSTRLMQRIGRVNRIGSLAPSIYNYMFYPSQQGDNEIQLYKNALMKLQGFHSAFGEDAQIYSKEEIVKEFKMFNNNVKDNIDKKLELLREIRELYYHNPDLYYKIKSLPMKSRVMRHTKQLNKQSIVFVSSEVKTEFYLSTPTGMQVIDFLDAVNYLKATPDEKPLPFDRNNTHYKHVESALQQYTREYIEAADTSSINQESKNKTDQTANKFLRTLKQILPENKHFIKQCDTLMEYINEGIYSQVPKRLKTLAKEYKDDREKIKHNAHTLQCTIDQLYQDYQTKSQKQRKEALDTSDPQIVISEYFV